MKLTWGICIVAAVAATPALAQPWQSYKGRITGGGGDRGKCTIEVRVDGSVELEISGAEGRMRTLTGSPASWTRMQCNAPMPANPLEFKFSGVDGRGNQYLVREPAQNRGVALIRIEDPKGGSEGYTFDLEWRGAGPTGGRGGVIPNNPGNGDSIFNGGNGNGRGRGRNPNLEVDFSGRGDGYYRTFRGGDELLVNCSVSVDRGGRIDVEFSSNQRNRLLLSGRIVYRDGNRLVADMAGGAIQGTMEILLNGRDNVEEVAMTGVGRNRLELRWNRR
jgi:hypothetical protein